MGYRVKSWMDLRKIRIIAFGFIVMGLALWAVFDLSLHTIPIKPTAGVPAKLSSQDRPQQQKDPAGAYGKLPLAFIQNKGQIDSQVAYYTKGSDSAVYFTKEGLVMDLIKKEQRQAETEKVAFRSGASSSKTERVVLRKTFVGANSNPFIEAGDPQAGKVNILHGNDPTKWQRGIPTYGSVTYKQLYSGIDLTYRGNTGRLKYEFIVKPGADYKKIQLAYAGSEGLSVNDMGDIIIKTAVGELYDISPLSYQEINGKRVEVESHFRLIDSRTYGFEVKGYDPHYPLIIDPGLIYSTYINGNVREEGHGIAVDGLGNAYITGSTSSTDFPTTPGSFQTSLKGSGDAFVTKLDPSGSHLIYSTYLGGTGIGSLDLDTSDGGWGIAVDAQGNAYVTGFTFSADFPTTAGAFQTTLGGSVDGFVAKLDPSGSSLIYSTFLGGARSDASYGIALDSQGDAYLAGFTSSFDFPTTPGAFDTSHNGFNDAFVAKLDPNGAHLLYSTYLGGSGDDFGYSIAVDALGNAYVIGSTTGGGFPTTPGTYDTSHNGSHDVFITKLNPTGSQLIYSTFLGGSSSDLASRARSIVIDPQGNVYVTGLTHSPDFPTTPTAFDPVFPGPSAFVAKLDANGANLLYSTFLNTTSCSDFHAIAVDAVGNAYVTGSACSGDFPTTSGAFQTTFGGSSDVYVAKLDANGSHLLYATYLGGPNLDEGIGIAVDALTGNAYVTGLASCGFPTTPGAFETTCQGSVDVFVTKLGTVTTPPIGAPATLTLTPPADTNTVGTSHTVTATVTDALQQPTPGITVRFNVEGSVTTSGSGVTDINGQTSFTYDGPPLPGADMIHAYSDTNNNNIQDAGEPFGDATKAWTLPMTTPGQVTGGGQTQNATATGEIAFGFNAESDDLVSGNCNVVDPSISLQIKCTTVTTLVVTGTHATLFGTATANGTETPFRIDVDDLAEPGKGSDTFRIILGTSYSAGGVLTRGNIQIHQ